NDLVSLGIRPVTERSKFPPIHIEQARLAVVDGDRGIPGNKGLSVCQKSRRRTYRSSNVRDEGRSQLGRPWIGDRGLAIERKRIVRVVQGREGIEGDGDVVAGDQGGGDVVRRGWRKGDN